MMSHESVTRREFLKLAGVSTLGLALPRFFTAQSEAQQTDRPNVLVVVYDAFSAYNMSLYGYPRSTTPHIDALAQKATVFHKHISGGNFTTPGTASLLTGTLPWTHRAMKFDDTVSAEFVERNMFSAFHGYHRMAYSHNLLANTLLDQFFGAIDDLTPWQRMYLQSDAFIGELFSNDDDIATVSWVRAIKQLDDGSSYSLFLANLYESYQAGRLKDLKGRFPLGLPNINSDNYFILEDATNHLAARAVTAPQPFLGYYHFLPPHFPYKTRQDFFGLFAKDGFQPPEKPEHSFGRGRSPEELLRGRTDYDEFIRYVDVEFARLYQNLEKDGLLDNTWLVLTADHGELFERGVSGHNTALLHGPIVQVPLLIFAPGQTERIDIKEATSASDILPTLMHVSGQSLPDWTDGRVLPPYGDEMGERDVYSLQAIGTEKEAPVDKATAVIIRGRYKLIYFFGYADLGGDRQLVELYNLEDDPQELRDLSQEQVELTAELLTALRAKLDDVNSPYR